ncbi:MAG: hypothetical protein AB1721_02600 [Patescibacteria group bacterium]
MPWPTKKLGEWIMDNLVRELIFVVFIFVFFKLFPVFVQAIKISRRILKDNRDTRGNAWGKYSADRFIDVWYSNPKTPLRFECGRFYYKTFNNPNSRHWMEVIDDELIGYELIEIFDAPRGYQAVRPIKTWRNALIARLVKWYLIKFVGDNPQYYKDLKEQSKH